MKKAIPVILLFISFLFAEIYVNGVPVDTSDTRYLIVEINNDSRKTRAYVDYGEDVPERKRLITDEHGEKMYFNSPVAVLNYLDKNGWEMDEVFVLPGGGETSSVYGESFFIFHRKE